MATASRTPRRRATPALDEIDELMEHSNLPLRTRRAQAHAAELRRMLDEPADRDTTHRVWRTRYWLDDDYTVVTLVHNLYPKTKMDGRKEASIELFVARGYHRGEAVIRSWGGGFHTDEIVAVLRLDLVDPDTILWRNETPNTRGIAIVSDTLGGSLARMAD